MSSGVGLVGQDASVAYAASKAGAMGMTRTLAVELGRYNIRCNAICPGYIQTPLLDAWLLTLEDPDEMTAKMANDAPLHRVGTIEDVGEAAAFLLSDASRFITGTHMQVDGGLLCGYK
jgi:NAD(P)-dependent dehydrogenase (short-subunit alcohol dehydrogenase family)